MSADRWGVAFGYDDGDGNWHDAPPATRQAIRQALGAPDDPESSPPDTGAIVITEGGDWTAPASLLLDTEDGRQIPLEAGSALPEDVLTGYHQLTDRASGGTRRLIVTPSSCYLPDDLFGWGWAAQLYAMRSSTSWGMGDLADLATLNRWSAQRGARFTLINPLHAAAPTDGQQPSPYFPTSRIWRNPLYLHIEDVPGWSQVAADLAPIAAAARSMSAVRAIDRDLVRTRKMAALEQLWRRWAARPAEDGDVADFRNWRTGEGVTVERYGTYAALVERYGGNWNDWPAELQHSASAEVASFAETHADRVGFHVWLQWLVERQLAAANAALPVMTDLAIGVDRSGADAWMWPEAFSLGMSVGAPPDTFNTQGQNWGLPPFNPWRLRDVGYEPFIRTVRSAFRGAGAVRMDHVMGLFRLWWIPQGAPPTDGCYVYLPFQDLLGILALESQRAQAGVVGEDLGTVEEYVRTELSNRQVLSYKLTQFESMPSAELPEPAMAAITTHDLPTIAGLWTGTDLLEAALVGSLPNTRGTAQVRVAMAQRAGMALPSDEDPVGLLLSPLVGQLRTTVCRLLGVGEDPGTDIAPTLVEALAAERNVPIDVVATELDDARAVMSAAHGGGVDTLIDGLHRELATAPCRLVSATLDDALAVEERPNLPGTVDERPNWRIGLPVPLEQLLDTPRASAIAAALTARHMRGN